MADFDLNRAVGLRPANNLSDVENPTEARTNIGAVGGGSVVPDSDGWHVTEGTVTPRTLTVTSTNITLNQDLQIVSTPQFAKIGIGQAAGTKEVLITGDVGITSTNQNMLTLDATGGADAGIAISSTNASNASRLKSVHDGSDDDFIIAVGGTDRANFTHEGFLFLGGATAQVSSEFIALTTPADSYGFMQSDGTTSVGTFVNAAAGWYGTFSSTPLHFFVNNSAVALLLDSSGNTHVTTTNTLFLDDITAGSVLFAGTSGVVTENNTQFFWDDTNELLQIGSSSGTSPEVIINTANNSGIAGIRLIEGSANAGFELFYAAAANVFNILSDNGGGQRNTRLSIVRDSGLVTIGGDLTLTAGDVNLTAGTVNLSTFTAGSVLFTAASGVVTEDNATFFWNDTDKQLGIGTATVNFDLHVAKSVISSVDLAVSNINGGVGAFAEVFATNNNLTTGGMRLLCTGTGFTTSGGFLQNAGILSADSELAGGMSILTRNAAGEIRFYVGGNTVPDMTLSSASDLTLALGDLTLTAGDAIITAGDVTVTAGTVNLSAFTEGSVLFTGASGVVTEDNSDFFWDDTNKRLIIGGTAGDSPVHVFSGSAGVATPSTESVLTLENSTHEALSFLTPNSVTQNIYFGDPEDDDVGWIRYSHLTDVMTFRVNAGIALTVSSTLDLTLATGDLILTAGDVTVTAGDVTITAGTVNLSAFTEGSVLFAGASGVVSEDNATFFWDDTNKRLGIGTLSPASDVVVSRSSTTAVELVVDNSNAGTSASAVIYATNDGAFTGALRLLATGTGFTPIEGFLQDAGVLSAEAGLSGGLSIKARNASADIRFYAGGNATPDMTLSAASDLTLSVGDLTLTAGDVILTAGDLIVTAGTVQVDQASTSGAVPVLVLDQGDIDDTFVNYIGTSAADSTRSISSSTAEAAAKFGAFRVEINGTTKWVRVYDSAV